MSLRSGGDFFARLIHALATDLPKIASGSSGEVSIEELHARTWSVAAELSVGLGAAPAPTDEDFCGKILCRLWKEFGRFTDRPLKFVYRLDVGIDADGISLPSLRYSEHRQQITAMEAASL